MSPGTSPAAYKDGRVIGLCVATTDVPNMDNLPLHGIYPETHACPIGKDYVPVTIKCQ